jgi:hypothetical protein
VAFLVLNGAVRHHGGNNPNSRFAALRAMVRHGSFRIDRLRNWTSDRARGPDGHLYSNKAPGPVLLVFPLAWALDRLGVDGSPGSGSSGPNLAYRTGFSLLFQAVPYAFVAWLVDRLLARRGRSRAARLFAALAILFGNTAVLFMNTFFGHGLAAWCLLGAAVALQEERYASAGLLFGWGALSDYALLPLAPLLLFGGARRGSGVLPAMARLLAGALVPALLYGFYHHVCFGSPFATALHYQSPRFAEAGESGLDRVFDPLPATLALKELSFGPARGILFTQPWVWVIFGLCLARLSRRGHLGPPGLLLLTLGGLPVLLWLNATFYGWHGGWSAGPRYLGPLFPLFALLGALLYDDEPPLVRALLWATLVPALVLRGLIYAGDTFLIGSLAPLWPAYLYELRGDVFGRHGLRFALFSVSLAAGTAAAWQLMRLSRPAAAD